MGDSSIRSPDDLLKELEEHKRIMSLIDDEIKMLMCKVRQLQFTKSQHHEKIKYCQGLMTLARRIPPELLVSIFEECIRDGWTRTPLTVSHVCSEWRKAAQTPVIWSHVYVNCDAKDPCGRTRFWLENARGSPLCITIDVRNDITHLPGVMNLLLGQVSHWQTLIINSVLLCHVNYILALCNRPVPRLRAMDISIIQESEDDHQTDENNGHDILGLMSFFPQAPNFSTLRISRNLLPSQGTIPPSITNLSISLPCYHARPRSSVDKVLQLLKGLPALRDLSIALQYGQAREFESVLNQNDLVNLLELRTLVLIGSPDIFRILPHILTPTLVSLHLRSSLDPLGRPEEQVGSYIRRFINRGSPPLELMELYDIDLLPFDFSACFAGLPSLKELRLHGSDIPDAVIQQFHGPEGFCPMLTRLDLRWCGQVTGRALIELVQARLTSAGHSGDNALCAIKPISMMTVIHCAFVKERDIIELAQVTICRIVMRTEDYCRSFGCCQNERYRRRFRLRCPALCTEGSALGRLII